MRTPAVTTLEPVRLPNGAAVPSTTGQVRAVRPAGPLTRGQRILLLCLVVLLMDQVTKAMQPAGTFIVNTGGPAILPSALGDALWKSHTFGAACDSIDTIVLMAALGATRKLTNTGHRVAVTAVLAGLLSNLVDRLGGSSLFHAGLPRGSIDWISVPAWPTANTNIADIVIALGILALACYAARRTIRASRALARHRRAIRRAAAAGVIALAVWTTIWQANRATAELHPTTPPSQCGAVGRYWSDGMDWVSYRPTGGPLAHHPGVPEQVPDCSNSLNG